MEELLEDVKIYNSSELQDFILKLETKYDIESAEEKYHNLVNFSTNAEVPYHQWFIYREGFASELITELIHMSDALPGECIIDGLNLQEGGSTIVWFGQTWSLELYQQLNARLWRQGQRETVVVHHIVTKGTIDENVMKALGKKDASQAALIDAVRAQIGG